jgi:hypothetical protein
VKSSLGVLLLLVSLPAFASVSVRIADSKTIDVAVVREPFSAALRAIQPYLPRPVDLLLGEADPVVSYRAQRIAPMDALRAIVTAAHLELADDNSGLWVRDRKEPSVTLDVKDTDARSILTSMQRQCGIRNLMIDPDVQGTGTFLFRNVPCRLAFDVVLRSLGLMSTVYDNSVIAVSGRTR